MRLASSDVKGSGGTGTRTGAAVCVESTARGAGSHSNDQCGASSGAAGLGRLTNQRELINGEPIDPEPIDPELINPEAINREHRPAVGGWGARPARHAGALGPGRTPNRSASGSIFPPPAAPSSSSSAALAQGLDRPPAGRGSALAAGALRAEAVWSGPERPVQKLRDHLDSGAQAELEGGHPLGHGGERTQRLLACAVNLEQRAGDERPQRRGQRDLAQLGGPRRPRCAERRSPATGTRS